MKLRYLYYIVITILVLGTLFCRPAHSQTVDYANVITGFDNPLGNDSLRGWWILDNTTHLGVGVQDTVDIAQIWAGVPNQTSRPFLQDLTGRVQAQDFAPGDGNTYYSATLAGTRAYTLGRNPLFENSSDKVSMHVWAKTNGDPSTDRMLLQADNGSTLRSFIFFFHSPSDKLRFVMWASNTLYFVATTKSGATFFSDYFDNNWHLFSAIYDGTNISIYVDGVLDCTPVAVTGEMDDDNVITGIGVNASTSGTIWNGSIAEVMIYKGVAHTAAQMVDYVANYRRLVATVSEESRDREHKIYKGFKDWHK